MGIRIISTGRCLPDRVLTNADLEKMVETSDEWIRTRTGIEERHIADADQSTSDLCFAAASNALESAGIDPMEIGGLIVGTITPDYAHLPSTACLLQQRLGCKNAFCFDLSAACSGLIYSLVTANSMMQTMPEIKYMLVFGAEKLSSIVNWDDRNTCVLFGDGASAVLLGRTDDDKNSILAFDIGADGAYAGSLITEAGGTRMPLTAENHDKQFVFMNGREIFKLAVNAMVDSSLRTLKKAGVTAADLKILIPHQANMRIINAVSERLGIDDSKVYRNVNRYGNTSAASIGLCLDEIVRSNVLQRSDKIMLDAFGGGLTWGSILIEW